MHVFCNTKIQRQHLLFDGWICCGTQVDITLRYTTTAVTRLFGGEDRNDLSIHCALWTAFQVFSRVVVLIVDGAQEAFQSDDTGKT